MALINRLGTLSNTQLASIYNQIPGCSVRKFADKVTAMRRVLLALEKAEMDFRVAEDGSVIAQRIAEIREGDDRTITLLATENPKRVGTPSHERFGIYQPTMTVGEYVRIAREQHRWPRKRALRDLTWDEARGYISVH